jgi:hypothetical protein
MFACGKGIADGLGAGDYEVNVVNVGFVAEARVAKIVADYLLLEECLAFYVLVFCHSAKV